MVPGGSNVNCKEKIEGKSLLMMAVKKKYTKIVELLLEAGARVDDTDRTGRTVMAMAELWGDQMILLKLNECLNVEKSN